MSFLHQNNLIMNVDALLLHSVNFRVTCDAVADRVPVVYIAVRVFIHYSMHI